MARGTILQATKCGRGFQTRRYRGKMPLPQKEELQLGPIYLEVLPDFEFDVGSPGLNDDSR
jgi:hypothetical protein